MQKNKRSCKKCKHIDGKTNCKKQEFLSHVNGISPLYVDRGTKSTQNTTYKDKFHRYLKN